MGDIEKTLEKLPRNVWISKRLRYFVYDFIRENKLNGERLETLFYDVIKAAIVFSVGVKKEEFLKYFNELYKALTIFKGKDYFNPKLLED